MKIGVVGCGHVGLLTTIALTERNIVYLYDRDDDKINMLKNGVSIK